MLLTNKELRKRLTKDIFLFIALEGANYFEKAEEYIPLHAKFNPEELISKISVWIEMVIGPLVTIIMAIIEQEPTSMFSMLSFYKCLDMWSEWFRYKQLHYEVHEWMKIVRSIGGPFISTNDPMYQPYVYADNMQRIHYSFFPKN